jgi:hypothetical protein
MINYEGRIFRLMSNTNNGDASSETPLFHHQNDLGMADYSGGAIVTGMLLARRAADGSLDMRYQPVKCQGRTNDGHIQFCSGGTCRRQISLKGEMAVDRRRL